MRTLVTAQQTAFFAQNGYIEFEGIDFDNDEIFAAAESVLTGRAGAMVSRVPSSQLYALGRDLWREKKPLETLLLRTIAPVALSLVAKPLRLACDQWIPAGYSWEKASAFKDLFCIQGLALGVVLCSAAIPLPARAPLGLLPLPKGPGSILFLKPELLIDWPSLAKSPAADLYFAAYAHRSAVYVQNPRDPSTNALKKLGYHFGDVLQNRSHPLLK